MKISIYDVVVGDVIPLRISDQVPADGVLISGHSLAIDESSMTGESKIVSSSLFNYVPHFLFILANICHCCRSTRIKILLF